MRQKKVRQKNKKQTETENKSLLHYLLTSTKTQIGNAKASFIVPLGQYPAKVL